MVWGCSSAGEHFVDIEGVTGSIPVTPTIFCFISDHCLVIRMPRGLLSHVVTGGFLWRRFVKDIAAIRLKSELD
jgi:hypothetical protein